MNSPIDGRLHQMIQKLKAQGMRLTPQRLAVLKILATDRSHPTVEEVYTTVRREFPMSSMATVYKTISVLKNMYELVETHSGGQAVRYDGVSGKVHPHLVCANCHAIMDVEFPGWHQFSASLQHSTGYQIRHYQMDIFGLCPNCQNQTLSIE